MRRLSIILAALALLALAPGIASARTLPRGFIGISPQTTGSAADFELMRKAGIESVRLPMMWSLIEPRAADRFDPDWTWIDSQVGLAAEQGMRSFPFLWGTPSWVAPTPNVEPVEKAWHRRAWVRFLHAAVARYGPRGRFWRENPDLPRLPIRMWEVWNEENIIPFSREPDPARFARLLRISGRVLHRADPGSRVILGGLFGRPLQVPPNAATGDFLRRVYAAPGIKRFFDGVALHPYVARARAMEGQLRLLRRIMRDNGDGAPIYVTEMGWGSAGYESRWERGPRGQARELDRAFALLARVRGRLRVGGAWWFTWLDLAPSCQFCDSAGLLTAAGEAKPAWYRFNRWTRGDSRTVPRASGRALRESQ